ncbi:transposase [Streptomyces melanogenes]|uniref:transposase n=1 Tax=Streptomyces melanogenes TaxID=67326 RepID=UPI0037B28DE0
MAGRAGHATPHRIQKFPSEVSWSADGLLAEAQAYAARELGDPSATLAMDDTQAIKKGDKSVGVGPQYCGTTGDVRNCQVMVMLTYAAASGHTFYDWRLYLPHSWCVLLGADSVKALVRMGEGLWRQGSKKAPRKRGLIREWAQFCSAPYQCRASMRQLALGTHVFPGQAGKSGREEAAELRNTLTERGVLRPAGKPGDRGLGGGWQAVGFPQRTRS